MATCLLSHGADLPVTKESLDKTFREKIAAFAQSPESTAAGINQFAEKAARIAESVYAGHPDVLQGAAKRSFSALPVVALKDLPAVQPGNNTAAAEIVKAVQAGAADLKAVAQFSRDQAGTVLFQTFDPARAAKMAMQISLSRGGSPETVGKHAVLSALRPDAFHRLNEDFLHPRIAMESLGIWFLIDLEWQEAGFYLPQRIETHRAGPAR